MQALQSVTLAIGSVVLIEIIGMGGVYRAEVVGFGDCADHCAEVNVLSDEGWGILGHNDYRLLGVFESQAQGP